MKGIHDSWWPIEGLRVLEIWHASERLLVVRVIVGKSGLASFCQSGKNQWKNPVITGMAKTLWKKWQKLAKTTWVKNICMTNIICKINLKSLHDHSYLKKIVYLECL